jgi:polysaccharide pyruvyl transferase WcaK-like protein
MAKKQNNKCIIFSSGIGDIYGSFAKSISKKALKLCDGIFLRTENDIKKCKIIDKELVPELCCDLAFFTKKENSITDTHKINGKYFLIFLRHTKKSSQSAQKGLVKNINEIAMQRKLVPVFVSMHPSQDDKISKEIASKCANAKLFKCKGMSDIISLVNDAEFGIGMRLHALVFCFLSNTPFVLLNYDRKCNDMFFHLNYVLKRYKLHHQCIVRANTDELSHSVNNLDDKNDSCAVFKKAKDELMKNNLEFHLYLEKLFNM